MSFSGPISTSGELVIDETIFTNHLTCAVIIESCSYLEINNSIFDSIQSTHSAGAIYVGSALTNGHLSLARTCFSTLTSMGYGNAVHITAISTAEISMDMNTVTLCYDTSDFTCSRTLCVSLGQHTITHLNMSWNRINYEYCPGARLTSNNQKSSIVEYSTFAHLTTPNTCHGIGSEVGSDSDQYVRQSHFVHSTSSCLISPVGGTVIIEDCYFHNNNGYLDEITELRGCSFDASYSYSANFLENNKVNGKLTPTAFAHLSTGKCRTVDPATQYVKSEKRKVLRLVLRVIIEITFLQF